MHATNKSFVVPNPLNIINDYLGVCLNCEFKHICPHIRESKLFITVERKDDKKQADQIALCNKMIEILKSKNPICPLVMCSGSQLKLCTGSFDSSVEEGGNEDVFFATLASNDTATKANVLTSVFYDRIKPAIGNDVYEEVFHRNAFAAALEFYVAKHLPIVKKEPLNSMRLEVKEYDSSEEKSHEKPRRYSSPTNTNVNHHVKSAKGSAERPPTPNNRLHLSLSNLTHSSGAPSPKKSPSRKSSSDKDSMRETLLKMLCPTNLNNIKTYWIESYKQHINKHAHRSDLEWKENQYCLIDKHDILCNPKMHSLVECVLSRDLSFELNPHTLMLDIHRTLAYIDKAYNTGLDSFSKDKILDASVNKEYNAEVSHFYYLLERMLSKIGAKHMEEQTALLQLWKQCATEHMNDLDNEAFVSVGVQFFRQINKEVPFNQKVISLLALLRQKLYAYPFGVIHEATADVPLEFIKKDPKRVIEFGFEDGAVEFKTFIRAAPQKDLSKWGKHMEPFSGFDLELTSIMRSDSSDFKTWKSKVVLNLNITRSLKNKHTEKIPSKIQQYIINPLRSVGFNINVTFVDSGFSKSG